MEIPKHLPAGKLRCIPVTELLSMFDASVHDKIRAAAQRMGATHIVVFENLQLDSSRAGDRTACCVGPTCTYKTPGECEGKWLNDLPSMRQYAVAYAAVEE